MRGFIKEMAGNMLAKKRDASGVGPLLGNLGGEKEERRQKVMARRTTMMKEWASMDIGRTKDERI